MKRFLVLFLSFSLLFSLVSCSVKPIESSEDELRVVGSVGKYEITFAELRFIALTYKKSLTDSLGENIFNDPVKAEEYRKELVEYIKENITYNYAVLELCAEVGLDLQNAKIEEAVQSEVEKLSDSLGGFSKYKKYLKETFLTDAVMRENLRVEIMQNELFYVYVDDFEVIESDPDKIYDIIKEDFLRVQHVYVSKSTKGADAKINEALSRIEAGDDFWSVVKEYGEDAELAEAGEYITRGYMNEAYENAAYSLAVNEHSGVIESDNGYFIVKRLELDPLYLMLNLETLSERYQRYEFLDIIYEKQRALEFVPNELFESLDILNLD